MDDVVGGSIPALTEEQMREVDRIMVEDLGIELMQMMENNDGFSERASSP